MARGTAVVAVVLGALLFAGTLAAGGYSAIPGLLAGAAVRAAGASRPWAACWSAPRRRLDAGAAGLLTVYADVRGPGARGGGDLRGAGRPTWRSRPSCCSWCAAAQQGERKYAGLRILR